MKINIKIIKFILGILFTATYCSPSFAYTRIKDITSVGGVRDNQLIGYGLVVGLNGTGDIGKNSVYTQKSVTEWLDKMGVSVKGSELKTRNIAFTIVTADLPPFSRQGSRIEVRVSAMGDAKSIKGGTLLATTLSGADGEVYAIAQGRVIIPDFQPSSDSVRTKSNAIETNGVIPNGAIVEREIDFKLADLGQISFALYNPDFTTAHAIAKIINDEIGGGIANALDSGTVTVKIPNSQKNEVVSFLSKIELLEINPDRRARVVISESTGTRVIGDKVKIRPVAIAQGNTVINVGNRQYERNLPNYSENKQNSYLKGLDSQRGLGVANMDQTSTLSDLVSGLNALGLLPRDTINVLMSMKDAGAIDAIIEVR